MMSAAAILTETTQKDGSVGVSFAWFNTLYQVLLGEEKGPRFGSFAALFWDRQYPRPYRQGALEG